MHEEKIDHTGFHAEIFRGQLPSGDTFLTKHFGRKSAHGFEPDYAVELIGHMRTFVAKAADIGVPVYMPIGYFLENNHVEGLVNLVEAVHHVGPDLKQLIDDPETPDDNIIGYVGEYLDIFKRIWDADFPIAIDPPPANFCLSKDGRFHFIDGMPPRQKLPNGKLLSEMPEPPESSRAFIESRYFSALQSRVIYAQLLRSLSHRSISPQEIKEAIGKHLGQEAYDLIHLDDRVKNYVLENPQPTDVDILRILAGEACLDGILTAEQMGTVFHDAHIGTGGILPTSEELMHAAEILKGAYAYH